MAKKAKTKPTRKAFSKRPAAKPARREPPRAVTPPVPVTRPPRAQRTPKMPTARAVARVCLRIPGTAAATYEVRIGSGLIPTAIDGLIRSAGTAGPPGGTAALVVVDANLSKDLTVPLLKALDNAGVRWGVSVVSASEADKSLASLERVLVEAGRLRLGRDGLIIALGGGVVGDVAGFAAAVFARGVRVVQCPTTLLSMVDASVGGKTGVNLLVPPGVTGESDASKPRLVKNLVGAFHQPARVICDLDALRTLSGRDLRAGLAECIKHGLLSGAAGDPTLLDWTERSLDALLAHDPKALAELVKRNVQVKARVVSLDPREEIEISPFKGGKAKGSGSSGGRMMLNLGHTFAHVLEPLPGISWVAGNASPSAVGGSLSRVAGPLRHGEAVGLGLLAACRVSESAKLFETGLAGRIESLLTRAGLPTHVSGLPETARLIERMADDKKALAGRVRLVLPIRGRKVRIEPRADAAAVAKAFDSLRERA